MLIEYMEEINHCFYKKREFCTKKVIAFFHHFEYAIEEF